MKAVDARQLVVGQEYVFGSWCAELGFRPTSCDYGSQHRCRLVIEQVGPRRVTVRKHDGSISKGYDRRGFFDIELARAGYRLALLEREQHIAPNRILTSEQIEALVQAL